MKERLNRREFLRRSAILVAGVGLTAAGVGYLLDRRGRGVDERKVIAPTPTPEKRVIHVPEGTYFEELKSVIEQVQQREDLKDLRDVYLGNVNDFDRGGVFISQGGMATITGGDIHGIEISIDPKTGEQTVREFHEVRPKETEVKIFIPEYLTRTTREKKDKIKMLYLDSGQNHPFRKGFEKSGYVIQGSVQRLLETVGVEIDQEVVKWGPNTEIYWGIVSGGVDPDKIQDGKFRLSDEYRYILFTETPLKVNRIQNPNTPGFAHLYSNLSVVDLSQRPNGAKETIIQTALMETAHMYGLPHCWEQECPMSVKRIKTTTSMFGKRCSMMGKNIGYGQIVEAKDPDNPRAYFNSGRLIPEDEARKDLEEHLQGYLSDLFPSPQPPGTKIESELGRKLDVVRFYQDGKQMMELSIPNYIGTVIVPSK